MYKAAARISNGAAREGADLAGALRECLAATKAEYGVYRVALFGIQGSGKSTLLRQLPGGRGGKFLVTPFRAEATTQWTGALVSSNPRAALAYYAAVPPFALVAFDEASRFFPRGKLGPAQAMLDYHRHDRKDLAFAARRPTNIAVDIPELATDVVVFQAFGPNDRAHLEGAYDCAPELREVEGHQAIVIHHGRVY